MAKTEESAPADTPRLPPAPDALTDERLLALAAGLVARGWSRTVLAEDGSGRRVEPWSASARSWSPLGALIAIWIRARIERPEVLEIAYAAFTLATGGRPEEWSAAPWRTKWHVLSAFARARQNLPGACPDPPADTSRGLATSRAPRDRRTRGGVELARAATSTWRGNRPDGGSRHEAARARLWGERSNERYARRRNR